MVVEKRGRMLIHPEKCTGCRVCEMECSFRFHKKFSPALSKVRILETPTNTLSYVIKFTDDCRDCLVCTKACVFGAMEEDKGDR